MQQDDQIPISKDTVSQEWAKILEKEKEKPEWRKKVDDILFDAQTEIDNLHVFINKLSKEKKSRERLLRANSVCESLVIVIKKLLISIEEAENRLDS
jgi:hypothetical protein